MKFTFSLAMLISLCIWMSTGCGTIVHGTMQDITISSEPANATIWINGAEIAKTPAVLNLKRKDDHVIRIVKEGYKDVEIKIESSTSAALFGNIFFGGLIGCIVDLSNGAAYSLNPDEVTIDLTKLEPGTSFRIPSEELTRVVRVRIIDTANETDFMLDINWQD